MGTNIQEFPFDVDLKTPSWRLEIKEKDTGLLKGKGRIHGYEPILIPTGRHGRETDSSSSSASQSSWRREYHVCNQREIVDTKIAIESEESN